jgi:hypothetical protein
MTQLDLAVEPGFDGQTISRYERGALPIPRVVQVAVKSLELGVHVD